MLEPLGFVVERNDDAGFAIRATKNCKVSQDFDPVLSPVHSDSLSTAICFISCGDMYVKGHIVVADTCIYDTLLGKVKAAGYQFTEDDMNESEADEKYSKDLYYFVCNREKCSLVLHYDMTKMFKGQ